MFWYNSDVWRSKLKTSQILHNNVPEIKHKYLLKLVASFATSNQMLKYPLLGPSCLIMIP